MNNRLYFLASQSNHFTKKYSHRAQTSSETGTFLNGKNSLEFAKKKNISNKKEKKTIIEKGRYIKTRMTKRTT